LRSLHLALALILLAVPAFAIDVDLTSSFSSGTIGDAQFMTTDLQPTGTGVIKPFVRIQKNSGVEHGFNTDKSPLNGDLADVKSGPWTHSVRVSDLEVENIGSGPVYRFLLDINQSGSSPLLSLNELRLFTASNPAIGSLAVLNAQNLIYDMGAGNRILLNHNIESGSGSGDMYCFLPTSLFSGTETQYLYLYSKFGTSGAPYTANSGFEEWAYVEGKKGFQ
jgi:hypothetical protein